MNILIFENEIVEVENAFKIFNLMFYKNNLNIKYHTNSQDFGDISNVSNYKLIMIDIDLAKSSEKDGFGILEDIKENIPEKLKDIIVVTGSSQVDKKLKAKGFDSIPILHKPIDYHDINNITKDFLKN